MKKYSRWAKGIVTAGMGAAVLAVSPANAQQTEPLLHEQLIDGVRGLFGRFFGGDNAARQAEATPASAAVAQPATLPAAPPQKRAEEVSVAAAAPLAPVEGRSLHEAVVRGDLEATQKLLEQGANIESKDPGSGASPLHYAVMKGRVPIVDLLIARGADVNSRTRNGTTPLHTAALYARKEIAERLLEKRADVNAVSASGATPLALAVAAKNHPIADMLRARGAK
jgi:cytohesin